MDDEAEAAFFQAQQSEAMTDSAPAELQEGDNSDSDDYDPSQTLGDDYPTAVPDHTQAHDAPTDATPTDNNTPNPTDATDMDASQTGDALDPSRTPHVLSLRRQRPFHHPVTRPNPRPQRPGDLRLTMMRMTRVMRTMSHQLYLETRTQMI